jgi:hypothetical protein
VAFDTRSGAWVTMPVPRVGVGSQRWRRVVLLPVLTARLCFSGCEEPYLVRGRRHHEVEMVLCHERGHRALMAWSLPESSPGAHHGATGGDAEGGAVATLSAYGLCRDASGWDRGGSTRTVSAPVGHRGHGPGV